MGLAIDLAKGLGREPIFAFCHGLTVYHVSIVFFVCSQA